MWNGSGLAGWPIKKEKSVQYAQVVRQFKQRTIPGLEHGNRWVVWLVLMLWFFLWGQNAIQSWIVNCKYGLPFVKILEISTKLGWPNSLDYLWYRRIHYSIHKSLQIDLILNRMDPVRNLLRCFFKINFSITLLFTLTSPRWSPSFGFSPQ